MTRILSPTLCNFVFTSRNDIKPSNLGLPYDYSFKTSKMLGQEKDYQQLPGGRRWYEIWSLKFDNCPPRRSASLCATYKYIFVLPKYMCTSIICAEGIFWNICIIWGWELVDCCKVEFGMRAVEITQAEECSFCIMYKKKPSPPNLSHICEKKRIQCKFLIRHPEFCPQKRVWPELIISLSANTVAPDIFW